MNRRSMLKTTGVTIGAVAIGGPLTLSQIACGSTKTMAKWTGVGIEMFNQMSPILVEMGLPNVAAIIAKLIPVAEKLKKAFEDNDHADILTLFDTITNSQTGLIVELTNAVGILQGPKRPILLGLLATASLMFRLIGNNIEREVPVPDAIAARTARPGAVKSVSRAAQVAEIEKTFAAVRF